MRLLTMKFTSYLWLYFMLEVILYIHDHIHTLCLNSIPMPILHARSHTLYLWPYPYSIVILHTHGHAPWITVYI